jgi:hypothetical protein
MRLIKLATLVLLSLFLDWPNSLFGDVSLKRAAA